VKLASKPKLWNDGIVQFTLANVERDDLPGYCVCGNQPEGDVDVEVDDGTVQIWWECKCGIPEGGYCDITAEILEGNHTLVAWLALQLAPPF
jgi:hypothetical protein